MSVVTPEDAYEQWKAAILDKTVPAQAVKDSSYILDAVVADVKCPEMPAEVTSGYAQMGDTRPIIKLKKKGNKDVSKEI